KENDPDVLALVGASTALTLSDIPWSGPMAAVRVARIGGQFVINPLTSQLPEADMNIVVAATRDAIVMVEGGANMLPEAVVLEGLFYAHDAIQPLLAVQEELRAAVGKPKRTVVPPTVDAALEAAVREQALAKLHAALAKGAKQERYAALDAAHDEVANALGAGDPVKIKTVGELFDRVKKQVVREAIVKERRRLDGRGLTDVRQI